MKNVDYCLVVISVLTSFLINNCTAPTAGVETTNGATVAMREGRVEGTAPPFASVYLFDTSYIPYIDTGLGVATVSDAHGFFSVGKISSKAVNVQVIDEQKQYSVIIPVEIDSITHKSELKRTGSLKGNVEVVNGGKVLVFLCGSGYYTLLDGSGEFNLSSIPPASYKIQAVQLKFAESGSKPVIVSSSVKRLVTINSGEVNIMIEKMVIP